MLTVLKMGENVSRIVREGGEERTRRKSNNEFILLRSEGVTADSYEV
jgi:hypothetical protein